MFEILLKVYRRIKDLHNLDDGSRLLVTFLPVVDSLEIIHHLLHISSILRYEKSHSLSVIQQFTGLYLLILHICHFIIFHNLQI